MNGMPEWPATRVTLLDRLHDPRDQVAWTEFVGLYGPLVFRFARRRLPQEEDAADIMQEVLSSVMGSRYQRPKGRFQKWLVTVLLNKIRDFHAARFRRGEICGDPAVSQRLLDEPSRDDEEEWEREREEHIFRTAAAQVQRRTNPIHWEVFVRTALQKESGQEVARALKVSLTNVYAIKSRLMQEIKDAVRQFGED
jgi:RNA polymerase sigma-70 factor (ECF subfamily)